MTEPDLVLLMTGGGRRRGGERGGRGEGLGHQLAETSMQICNAQDAIKLIIYNDLVINISCTLHSIITDLNKVVIALHSI